MEKKEKYDKELPHHVYLIAKNHSVMDSQWGYESCVQVLIDQPNLDPEFCKDIIDSIGSSASKIISNTDTWKSNESIKLILNNTNVFFTPPRPKLQKRYKHRWFFDPMSHKCSKTQWFVDSIAQQRSKNQWFSISILFRVLLPQSNCICFKINSTCLSIYP